HLLSGGIADWGYFHSVTTRNRPVTFDFDCRFSLLSGNNLFRPSPTDFGWYQSREKKKRKKENMEYGIALRLRAISSSS
ncbi:hypothetical protein GW17_00059625, partial [Ensete ventricosum]